MLAGTRIIEIEGLGPGPFAGMTLADLGAEVIVVHREAPPIPGMPERNILDRGKRSVVLDLKDPQSILQLKKLVASADGLIEGFRPDVMERLGLGPDNLRKINPSLVYGRITGWGQEGPKAQDAGHDLNYIALSGALWYASPPGIPPFTPPTLVGDIGGGAMYLVVGMLAALINAKRTGEGSVVDAAIVDGSAHMMNLIMSMQQSGVYASKRGRSLLDGSHWSRCYVCSDGEWISVQCLEQKFYAVFLEKLQLNEDKEFLQQQNPALWPKLAARLTSIFAEKPQAHWAALFENTDSCVAPVNSPAKAAEHPHMAARETWVEIDGQLQARSAPRFNGAIPTPPDRSPSRGEHTEEILKIL